MSSLGYEILSKEKLEVLTKLAEGYFNKGGTCTSDYLVGAFALLRSHDVFGFYARMVGDLDSIPILQSIYDFYFATGTFWFYIKAGITLVIVSLIVLGILQFKKMLRNKYRGSWRLWIKNKVMQEIRNSC